MKVLYVDQFGKTSGCYSLPQAQLINDKECIDITEYISDNIDFSLEKYSFPIVKGFTKAFEGNALSKAFNYIKALYELRKYVLENNVDILHLQWFSLPWIEWMFVKEMKRHCKVIITIHDVIPFNNRPLEMNALNIIYKNADYLLLHTNYAVREFKKYYDAKTNYEVITQGFCLKKDYIKLDNKMAKHHFGINPECIVFLYYGTIRESKGLDILIEAIGKASEENRNVFLLAGGAFQKVDEEKYKQLVEKYLNKDNSHVTFAFVPTEEEQWYFSAADTVVLPYREITQSGVAQTALMYELPIIATNIGDMKEVARPDVNGDLINVDDVDMLCNTILKMAANSDLRERYSMGSKELSENEFSLENKSHIVAEVYKKIYNT